MSASTPLLATVTLNPSLDEWITLPALRLGELNRAVGWVRYAGGKGINVSRVIHELGGRTVAFALAGGMDGAILDRLLQHLELPHQFVTIAGSTRNNYKLQTGDARTLTEINTAGPRVSLAAAGRLMRRLLQLRPHPACVAISGSLPPGVPATLYGSWIRRLRRLGIRTALDTSGQALAHGLSARPWVVKPNRQEAEALLGVRLATTAAYVRAVQALIRRGARIAVLSLGREGAMAAAAGTAGIWQARSPRVRVDSPVGAGDSLVGGFLIGWALGRALPEALRLGVACGAATAMTPGTELCHRGDIERIARRVVVRRVA